MKKQLILGILGGGHATIATWGIWEMFSIFIFLIVYLYWNTYVWVHNRSNMPMFCLKKTHFTAMGGPKFAIFGRDDLDPLYFDVINFSVPPAKMY